MNTVFAVKRLVGRKFDSEETRHAREVLPYEIVRAGQRRRQDPRAREGLQPGGDLGLHPAGDQGVLRGGPRRGDHRGDHHRARLLRRRAAAGHARRRPDRGARGPAHLQRADGRLARLRPRPEGERGRRRLRPRRRDVRHLDPRAGRRHLRGQGDGRRHLPRRRGLRQEDHGLAPLRLRALDGHRPAAGPDGAPATEGGGGEGQVRALDGDGDDDHAAVHLRGLLGAQAHQPDADARSGSSRSSRT